MKGSGRSRPIKQCCQIFWLMLWTLTIFLAFLKSQLFQT
jgi:hypothetical protein